MNKAEIILRLQPHIKKLIAHYQSKGVLFNSLDGVLKNVVFYNTEKSVSISHEIFFRFSGICCTHRDKGQNEVEVIPLTDDAFMNVYMKAILDMHFFPKINK